MGILSDYQIKLNFLWKVFQCYGLIFNILADKGFKAENINVSPKQYYKISYFHYGYCEVISLLFPQFHLV